MGALSEPGCRLPAVLARPCSLGAPESPRIPCATRASCPLPGSAAQTCGPVRGTCRRPADQGLATCGGWAEGVSEDRRQKKRADAFQAPQGTGDARTRLPPRCAPHRRHSVSGLRRVASGRPRRLARPRAAHGPLRRQPATTRTYLPTSSSRTRRFEPGWLRISPRTPRWVPGFTSCLPPTATCSSTPSARP